MNFNFENSFDKPEIKITYGHSFIAFEAIDFNKDFDLFAYDNIVEYRNVWDNVSLLYEKKDLLIKEEIEIKTKKSNHVFNFKINSNLIYKKINENHVFVDPYSNKPYYKLDKFIVFNKNNEEIECDIACNYDESNRILNIDVKKLKTDQYPIIIDPSIIIIPHTYSPAKLNKNQTVDLDIIHRSDKYGSDYYKEQFGTEFPGDTVSFSRKVNLRLNIQNKVKSIILNGTFSGTKNWIGFTSKNESGKWKNYNKKSAKAENTTSELKGKLSPPPIKNHTYQITYTISNYVSGGIKLNLGGADGVRRSSDGTFTENITATNNSQIKFIPDVNGSSLIIDSVLVYDLNDIKDSDLLLTESKIDISKIQVDVAGTKYVIVNPLADTLEESNLTNALPIYYSLTVPTKELFEGQTITAGIHEDTNGLLLKWSLYAIDNYTKKLMFSHEDILNKISNKTYGQCSFSDENLLTEIKYTAGNIISDSYYVLINLDLYDNNILKNGKFLNPNDWDCGVGWAISTVTDNHKISCSQSVGSSSAKGSLYKQLINGHTYQVSYKVENFQSTGSSYLRVLLGGNKGLDITSNENTDYSIDEIKCISESSIIEFVASGNISFDIKNISVVDLTDTESYDPIYTLTEFVRVFSIQEKVNSPSLFFSLDPDNIKINESNKNDKFDITTVIPRRSMPYLSASEFKWRLKKFESGTISTVIDIDESNVNTEYGKLIPSRDSKSLQYYAPPDLTIFTASYFIESSVVYFDTFSGKDKTLTATCVLHVLEDYQITPNYLRPTICKQANLNYRIHNFRVIPTDPSNISTLVIPNDETFEFYWLLYVNEDSSNQDVYESWKVIHPNDATNPEIKDLHTNSVISPLDNNIFYKYGGISSHFHVDQNLESVGYTLGNKNKLIDYISSGQKLPDRLYLTYNYKIDSESEGGSSYKQLLSIIQPSQVVPEDCSDEIFTITLDKHVIIASSTESNSLNAIFSSDINNLYSENPYDFILVWSVERYDPTNNVRESLDPEDIIILGSNIKSIIVKPIDDNIIDSSDKYLIITATLTYMSTNKVASDSCFVLKNTDGFTVDDAITVSINGGKKLTITIVTNPSPYGLTYNHSDYSNKTSASRKIKLEILDPMNGEIVVGVDDILYPTGSSESKKYQYGYAFLDYQFPTFNTISNKLVPDSSYKLSNGICYHAPPNNPQYPFVILRTGIYNPSSSVAKYEYYYTLITFINQLYPNIYPDVFKSSIDGVDVKTLVGNDKDNYSKKIFMEPDRAYEFKISKDLYDDGNLNTSISQTGYEVFLYYKKDDIRKIVNYYSSTVTKEGILQESWGITNSPIRSYVDSSGNQCFNIQMPPDSKPFTSDTNNYYDNIYDANSKLDDNLYLMIVGQRNDTYETIIEINHQIKKLPSINPNNLIYKNPKHGFFDNPQRSIFLIDPLPANIPDLTRHYLSNTVYYIYVIVTNSDLISKSSSRYINLYMDTTPNDVFGSSDEFVNNKTFYSLELDTAFSQTVNSRTLVYREKFAFGNNSNVGNINLIGGVSFEGSIANFFTEFDSKFGYTYSGTNAANNSKLESRLNRLISQKYYLFNNLPNNTDNINLQVNVYKWTSPTYLTDVIPIKISALSGKSIYLSESNSTTECYYDSSILELKEPDPKPTAEDVIKEDSIYVNRMNNDIYIGLVGNGMKYAISNNYKEYSVPSTTQQTEQGYTYDPDLEENLYDRFIFPDYRYNGDGIINYDYTNKLGEGNTIDADGIDFPDTVTKFLLYFDHINIKYILFFGTSDNGLWCFDDIDIYSNIRSLQQHGLCKRVFLPSAKYAQFSDEITDIKLIFPSLDVCFSTADSIFILKAETISLYQLNTNIIESNLWQNKILAKASKHSFVGSSDSVKLGSGQTVKYISSICPIAKPDLEVSDVEHSGRLIISDQDISHTQGIIITLVIDDYTAIINYGDLIWHIELLYNIDDNRTIVDISNDFSAATRYNKLVVDSNAEEIHIPDVKIKNSNKNLFLNGFKNLESIDTPLFVGGNYFNIPGHNSRSLIATMHRQETWITQDVDEATQSSTISSDFGIDGINGTDITDKPFSEIHDDFSNKVFMNPFVANIPLNTRMSDGNTTNRSNCITNIISSNTTTHLSENAKHVTEISSLDGGTVFSPFIPSSSIYKETINNDYDGDIFWRLYYNLVIKDSGVSVFDIISPSVSGFKYMEYPGSNYTLIQVPKVKSNGVVGKSLWLNQNDDPAIDMKTLLDYLNVNIDEDSRDLYIKQFGGIVSLKLKKINENIKYINLITGSFLISTLKQSLSTATNDDLVFLGHNSGTLTSTQIQDYLDHSNRDFILVCHEPKIQINNSGTSTAAAAEKQVYWNGYSMRASMQGPTECWIYESVKLQESTTDSRKAYVGGLTYYNDSTSSFSAFAESVTGADPNTIQSIPNSTGGSGITTDIHGTVLYAENSIKKFLNPLFSVTPYKNLNNIFHFGHGIIDDADKSDFYGNDTGSGDPFAVVASEIVENNSVGGANFDRFLYKQLFDYMKVVQYVSYNKSGLSPVNSGYNSEFIDIHGLWSHDFNIDPYYCTHLINSQSGTRRQKLIAYKDCEESGRTYFRNPYRMSGFYPNWAYDGFWQVWDGGKAINVTDANKAMPILTKSPLPTIFAGDTKIRDEERDYPYNFANVGTGPAIPTFYFDQKNYFITHFINTNNGQRILYTVKTKDLTDTDYCKNKIHVYYSGTYNVCGDDFTPSINYDFESRFPYDFEGIDHINNLYEMETIECFNYSDDFYETIDVTTPITFSISGTVALPNPNGIDNSETVRIIVKENGSVINTLIPTKRSSDANTGDWDKTDCLLNANYIITPSLNGYTFKNTNNESEVSFNHDNYSSKNFSFVGTFTGTGSSTFDAFGRIGITSSVYTSGNPTPSGITVTFTNKTAGLPAPAAISNLPVQTTSGTNKNYATWTQTNFNNNYSYTVTASLSGYTSGSADITKDSTNSTIYLTEISSGETGYHRSGTISLDGSSIVNNIDVVFEDLSVSGNIQNVPSGVVAYGQNASFSSINNKVIYLIGVSGRINFSTNKHITLSLTYYDWLSKTGRSYNILKYEYYASNSILGVLVEEDISENEINKKSVFWSITEG